MDKLLSEINNCKNIYSKTKFNCIDFVDNQITLINNLNFDKKNNISKKERKLITDICLTILENVKQGKFGFIFDLQYNNPRKRYYKQGPPIQNLSKKGHQWFNDLGFFTKDIKGCWNKSSSCEFGCYGDGVISINICWDNKINFNKLNENEFNSKFCYNMSNIISKMNNIL